MGEMRTQRTHRNRPGLANELRRWRAVQTRDAGADAGFVYAVRSTGIYCRPSCPSRRPRREHVVFFAVPEAAEREGFRPCRRCRPQETTRRHPYAGIVARICRHLESSILTGPPEEEPRMTLAALSARAGLSPAQLERAFLRVIGITPRQYADAQRMHRLKSDLKKGDDVTTALYNAGYGSSSRLYERAPAQMGMTPATYRRGGAGMRIGYTVAACPLGRLLVAATARGISAVYLGNDDRVLSEELRREYPQAEISRDRNGLSGWVQALLGHLRGRGPRLDLPLDVQATAFQRRVWEALRRIPYGSTCSYSQIARAIGRPKATRAVARACATNPVSVVVPCHRVVREDGSLAGYRWGLDRKRSLLAREQAAAGKKAVRGQA
jgi:AraC family transcriptional regulator of adaptative response/methylated-DNA-[protein]-cysteine methyltransferase